MIAINKPKNIILKKTVLEYCFKEDCVGGFSVSVNGKLKTYKGFVSFKTFWNKLSLYMPYEMIIYIGDKHTNNISDNCEPFYINDTIACIYDCSYENKIKNDMPNELSDSIVYHERILKPLINKYGFDIIFDDIMCNLYFNMLKIDSKILFITADGSVYFNNKDKGITQDGCWFSNKSFLSPEIALLVDTFDLKKELEKLGEIYKFSNSGGIKEKAEKLFVESELKTMKDVFDCEIVNAG